MTLNGDWIGATNIPMTKDDEGVWSVTVGPLDAQLYGYWFMVDGQLQARREIGLIASSRRTIKKVSSIQKDCGLQSALRDCGVDHSLG